MGVFEFFSGMTGGMRYDLQIQRKERSAMRKEEKKDVFINFLTEMLEKYGQELLQKTCSEEMQKAAS